MVHRFRIFTFSYAILREDSDVRKNVSNGKFYFMQLLYAVWCSAIEGIYTIL